MAGDPRYEASQALPPFPYASYAELVGLRGIRVEHPGEVGPAWEAALGADRPVVIEACVDPDVPPLPPHISLKQAKAFGMSLLKMDPEEGGVLKQTLRQTFPSLGKKAES